MELSNLELKVDCGYSVAFRIGGALLITLGVVLILMLSMDGNLQNVVPIAVILGLGFGSRWAASKLRTRWFFQDGNVEIVKLGERQTFMLRDIENFSISKRRRQGTSHYRSHTNDIGTELAAGALSEVLTNLSSDNWEILLKLRNGDEYLLDGPFFYKPNPVKAAKIVAEFLEGNGVPRKTSEDTRSHQIAA